MIKNIPTAVCFGRPLFFFRGGLIAMATTRIMPLHIGKGRTESRAINQALANEYASHIAANEQQVEQALEFKARLYESLITGTMQFAAASGH